MIYTNLLSDSYQHRRHNKNLLVAHIVFVTKYRKKIMFGYFNLYLKQVLFDICVKHHWYIKAIETDKDHIHILLQYNSKDSIAYVVKTLKQISTFEMWKHYQHYLSKYYWKERTLWSDGYFACSIGNASEKVIKNYIENQG